MGSRSFHKTEAPYSLPNDAPEWDRLDFLHNGVNDYMGNRITFAEIETPPKRIIEIGSGSGAWAIQAAQTYPDAEVLAIDLSPLPPRPFPDNVKFQAVNVTESLPFEPESFDVVHIRFVLIHLPNFRDLLARFIELVKPGGWISIEDTRMVMPGDSGPGIKKFYEVYLGYMSLRNVNPMVGPLIAPTLIESGKFSEVHIKKVSPKLMGNNGDPSMDHLAEVLRTAFFRGGESFDPNIVAYGMSDEVIEAWQQEVIDPERKVCLDLYFAWGRKL